MITTKQLQQLAYIVSPKSGPITKKYEWIEAAKAYTEDNKPIIADSAALASAFGVGAAK